jgi:WD40 repeat protein
MAKLVDRAIVRVFENGTTAVQANSVGVGFLAGAGLVLTCAHVVRAAVGRPALELGDEVMIDFPMTAPGEFRAAVITHLADSPGDMADVAGLAVGSVPDGARALRVVAADEITGHRVQAFGVTENRDKGVWSEGILRRPIADGVLQIEDDRAYGVPMRPGFSGSPLIDLDLLAVIGMVTEVESRPERRVAYALSGRTLHRYWPQLGDLAAHPAPFRGLQPFRQGDKDFFFGREDYVADVVGRLDRDGLCLIAGPSGCGKSSAAQAGVLPALSAPQTGTTVFRPAAGSTPWHALAGALAGYLFPSGATLAQLDELAGQLRSGSVDDALNRVLVLQDLRRLVILVDQFDEAVAQHPAESESLLAALLDASSSHRREPRVDVLVTVSSDALDGLLADPRFSPRTGGHIAILGPPAESGLRAIVEQPLAEPGMPVYERGLAEAVIQDVASERNPLPLIEFTLTMLWEHQEQGVLTHEAYRELGGVAGALGRYAEQVSERYLADEASAAELRWLLCQLISPVEPDRTVRRVVPLDQLGPAARLARELAGSRLVTLGTLAGERTTAELAHEALIRHWPRLHEWVRQDREFRSWQDELDRQAALWRIRPEGARLLRGTALRDARARRRARGSELTARQRLFIRASIRRHRYRRMVTSLTVLLVVVLISTVTEAVVSNRDQRIDQAASNAAQSLLEQEQQLGDTDPLQGLSLTVRAFRTDDNLTTRAALYTWATQLHYAEAALPGTYRYLGSRPISPDGSHVVLLGPDGKLNAWNLAAGQAARVDIPLPEEANGFAVTWLGNGSLVTSSTRAATMIWDADTGRPRQTLPFGANVLATDASGRWLGYGDTGRSVFYLKDMTRPSAPARAIRLPEPIGASQGAGPNTLEVSDVLSSGELLAYRGTDALLISLQGTRALNTPAGARILDDGSGQPQMSYCTGPSGAPVIQVHDLLTGRLLHQYNVPAGAWTCDEASIAFSGDSRDIAVTVSSGGQYDTSAGRAGGPLSSFATPAGYSPAAVTAESSGGERILLWGMDSMLVLRVPPPDPLQTALDNATGAQVNGNQLILQFKNGHIEDWNTATRRRIGITGAGASDDANGAYSMPINATGDLLASVSADSAAVNIWQLPKLSLRGSVRLSSRPTQTFFSGSLLIALQSQSSAYEATTWNVNTLSRAAGPAVIPAASSMNTDAAEAESAVIPRPGSDELVERDGTHIRLMSLSDGRVVQGSQFTIPANANATTWSDDLAIDNGGRYLAVLQSSSVEIWDLDSHKLQGRLPVAQGSSVTSMQFLADPKKLEITLAASGTNNEIQAEIWTRDVLFGIPKWFGFLDYEVTPVATTSTFEVAEDYITGNYYLLQPANPQQWLGQICGISRYGSLNQTYPNIPVNSWTGPLCPGPH